MAIRRTYGGAAAAKAGLETGRRRAEQQAAAQAAQISAQRESAKAREKAIKEQRAYQDKVRQIQQQWNLEAENRARAWQLEKMETASRMDFQRQEAARQKKLTDIDNKLAQLDKEKESGRFSTNEPAYANAVAYWTAQRDAIESGVSKPSVPWYQHPAMYSTPEAQLERQRRERQGTGVIPYYLDKKWLQSVPPEVGEQALAARDIFFDNRQDYLDFVFKGATSTAETMDNRVRVISPNGQSGTILKNELQDYLDQGFKLVGDAETTEATITNPTSNEAIVQAREALGLLAGEKAEQYYHPSLGNFATMSPLRLLLEQYKARKMLKKAK
jgi:hypothetical protein